MTFGIQAGRELVDRLAPFAPGVYTNPYAKGSRGDNEQASAVRKGGSPSAFEPDIYLQNPRRSCLWGFRRVPGRSSFWGTRSKRRRR